MKIALCLSGELRSIHRCLPTIKIKLLDNFDDYDIFYHTWSDDPDIAKLHLLVKTGYLKDLLIEPRITFNERNYNNRKRSEVFIQGFLRQLYCLKKCNDLKRQYEIENNFTYDVVIRMRPDNYIIDTMNLNLDHIDENTVYVPRHDNWHGYCDRLYYGSSEVMDIISNRFDHVDEYFNKGGIIHYETYMKYIVDINDIHVERTDVKSILLRNNGEFNGELVDLGDVIPNNTAKMTIFS